MPRLGQKFQRLTWRERFIRDVQWGAPKDCWPWVGRKAPNGYGKIRVDGKDRGTHRLAFELHHRRPPKGLVLHKCGNRPCCNWRHLYEGNDKQNARDRERDGHTARGPKHGMYKHGRYARKEAA
jgi:hypothetical protein